MIPKDFEKAKYVNLYTFKRDGSVVKTTVLVGKDGDRLLVHTGANSGKVKRIRNNPNVFIEPSNLLGKSKGEKHKGTARILKGNEREVALQKVKRCCIEKLLSYIFHDVVLGKKSAIIEIIVVA